MPARMRRPRPGDDNGDDHYGVRVDEPRRHLSSPLFSSSPLLPFSFSPPLLLSSPLPPSPPFSFLSSSSSLLFLLLPPPLLLLPAFLPPLPPTSSSFLLRARGPGSRWRRRGGGGAGARACVCVCGVAWCVCGVCVCPVFFYISNLFAEGQIRGTRQRKYFAECLRSGTRRNKKLKKILSWLCRVPRASTRQNIQFAECQTLALGKIIFFCFLSPTFFLRFVFVP